MKQKPDGGPAYPGQSNAHATAGMTLRDYFAGQALDGLLAGSDGSLQMELIIQDARICYAYADAMIAARKETNK